jgi:hypothetical protein
MAGEVTTGSSSGPITIVLSGSQPICTGMSYSPLARLCTVVDLIN